MKDKCTKYEALFTFGNDETLRKHVETCEDCKKEQEVMDRVSDLLREVAILQGEEKKCGKVKSCLRNIFYIVKQCNFRCD